MKATVRFENGKRDVSFDFELSAEVSRQLTGTTSETGRGLFYNLYRECEVYFCYGDFSKRIVLNVVVTDDLTQTAEDILARLLSNISKVREFVEQAKLKCVDSEAVTELNDVCNVAQAEKKLFVKVASGEFVQL